MSTFNNGKAVLLSFTAFSKMIIYHPKQTEMVLINFYFLFIFLSSFLDDTSIEIIFVYVYIYVLTLAEKEIQMTGKLGTISISLKALCIFRAFEEQQWYSVNQGN